jgi:ABC-type transport system substrate-binding protein
VQVQSMLHAVGIDAQIKDFAPATYFAPASAGGPLASGNYDLGGFGWLSGTDLDDSNLFTCAARPPNGRNYTRYCSLEMEALQRRARAAYDDAQRRALYAKIEALLVRDVPMVFVSYPRLRAVRSADLRRPAPNFVTQWWNVAAWSFGG